MAYRNLDENPSLLNKAALAIAIIALLACVPVYVVSILAYMKPASPDYLSRILQLENTLSTTINTLSHNVTKTVFDSGTCYLQDDNLIEFTTTYEAYTLDYNMGDYSTVVLEVSAFANPVSVFFVSLVCRSPNSDLNWNRVVSPINSHRMFSPAMMANFTFVGLPRLTAAQDGALGIPNYQITSPTTVPSQPGFFFPGSNLRLQWQWDPILPWTYGVDAFNFNGFMRFSLATTYPSR